jgi:hypothetical protein
VYVLTSRSLPVEVPDGVSAWHDGVEAFLARLRDEGLTHDVWVMGGPKMVQSFRALGALSAETVTDGSAAQQTSQRYATRGLRTMCRTAFKPWMLQSRPTQQWVFLQLR